MIDRRRAICLSLLAIPAASLLSPVGAHAEQAFQRFIPFLVDLDGWQGKKPEGMAMEMPGTSMIIAGREYQRGPARVHVQILIGSAAQGALAATQTGINVETTDGRMSTTTIDGLPVTKSINYKQKAGAILVALRANSVFSVSFNDISDDEALALARKFDWKAIQAALPK
jgi:hypothetical protein